MALPLPSRTPRLYKWNGIWHCRLSGRPIGLGFTPIEAWNDYIEWGNPPKGWR